ncbi:NitT/TauT family transport system substrate-binding protein [Actinoplanes lutulentus]|uniref:NitT/TauT family transport system substrate-binding protein n=1 Tax=Actinoplanes lutulentus TaxID=1287878 RepID=A0A327Z876_9ACTN|nr:ABC transporter substrate-binding protein [Actinoplanes lutulentus]MBB2946140.1 NitT/TauT family transport system substrate-binding protein [Actinoplanes lutulentus]RAK32830.1 NitT/TauT family transport system substrate-binding protein [Actinoplanes lutulentus]
MSSRTTRALALASAAVVASTALAACGSNEDDNTAAGTSGTAAEAKTINLGYFPNITHAPALVGVNKGLFKEALGSATTLETKTFNAGPAAIEALLSGAIDATYIGPNPAINGWSTSKGTALKIIAGSTSGGAGLVVKEGINSAADLKGKKIATPQLGNTQDVALRAWLKENGLNADTTGGGDVSVLPQDNATAIQAFAQGTIDGAWVPEPNYSKLILESKAKVLVDEKTLWPNQEFVTTHLIVSQKFLKEYPGTVKKLLQGHINAVKYIKDNSADAQTAANAQIESLTGKPLKAEILTAAFANLKFTYDPIASSLYTSAQHAEEVGLLKTVDLKGIYDLGPLNELLKADGQPEVSDAAAS